MIPIGEDKEKEKKATKRQRNRFDKPVKSFDDNPHHPFDASAAKGRDQKKTRKIVEKLEHSFRVSVLYRGISRRRALDLTTEDHWHGVQPAYTELVAPRSHCVAPDAVMVKCNVTKSRRTAVSLSSSGLRKTNLSHRYPIPSKLHISDSHEKPGASMSTN